MTLPNLVPQGLLLIQNGRLNREKALGTRLSPYLAPDTHLVKSMDPSWVMPAAFSSRPCVTRSSEIAEITN